MPGANTDDVTVVISDDRIVIRGEIRNEHEEQGEGLYRCERTHGEFYRVIPLPEGADTEQAQADINNGILEISVPVSEGRQRQREIPIRTEGREQARAASAQRK
jgi:HSP20 family protein